MSALNIAGALPCRSWKQRRASTEMSTPSSCDLLAGWRAELMPLLGSSSTTRILGAPSGLTP
eukprot:7065709-Pyramimonas_sp.AAC.1